CARPSRCSSRMGRPTIHLSDFGERRPGRRHQVGTWLIDEWSKIGLRVNQRVVPTGPWYEAMRSGSFDVVVEASCNSVVNPLLDVQKYLPHSVLPAPPR